MRACYTVCSCYVAVQLNTFGNFVAIIKHEWDFDSHAVGDPHAQRVGNFERVAEPFGNSQPVALCNTKPSGISFPIPVCWFKPVADAYDDSGL